MIFIGSIKSELAQNFSGLILVLLGVSVSFVMIQTFGMAYKGTVNPNEVMQVMVFMVLGQLPILLSLTLFLAIALTLNRMYIDGEMTIWLAVGQDLKKILKPILAFSVPIIGLIALMSILVWPWGHQQANILREQYVKRGDLERIEPGKFKESADGKWVIFMDKDSDNAKGQNIFLQTINTDGSEVMISAREGRVERSVDEVKIVLLNGEHLNWDTGNRNQVKQSTFASYERVLEVVNSNFTGLGYSRSMPTLDLLKYQTNKNLSELSWRIGLVLMSINFVLIAVTLAGGNPRLGKSAKVIYLIFAYLLYFNMMAYMQDAIAEGSIGFFGGIAILHGGVFVMASVMLGLRAREAGL